MKARGWKILNSVCFVLVAIAGAGSINKPLTYLPDSLIYQVSLLALGVTYLFNYWCIQQTAPGKLATISNVVNIGAGTLFLVGIVGKPEGGIAGIVLVLVFLLPLAGTAQYLRGLMAQSKEMNNSPGGTHRAIALEHHRG